MAERPRAHTTAGITRNRTAAPAPPTAGVRRNLFQGQLTRRPTAGSAASTDTLRLDVEVLDDSSEIVVRDKHGEIELGDPPTPILEDEDELPLDNQQESQKERQRLAEAVKQHQIRHSTVPNQPEELLEAVRASLRAKVAALAEDNWMYEPEEQPRG